MNDLRTTKKTLLIGIGNSGRSDDGLGWNFVDMFATHNDAFDIEYRYQLQVEDAELLSQYERIIFVDASHELKENGFSFYDCLPKNTSSFTTHKLEPEMVLWLAVHLYGKQPKAHVLAITGVHWELQLGLSEEAIANCNKAVAFFSNYINDIQPVPA